MNAVHRLLAALFVAAALTACGAGQEQAQAPAADNALKDMVGTMDKARGVETTTMEHKKDLDKAMEAAAGER